MHFRTDGENLEVTFESIRNNSNPTAEEHQYNCHEFPITIKAVSRESVMKGSVPSILLELELILFVRFNF
jgi:hypothetical protein